MPSPPPTRRPATKRYVWIAVAFVAAVLWEMAVAAWLAGVGHRDAVKRIAHADPTLQSAARRAQAELDTFVTELETSKAGERFAIKGAFTTPAGTEYLWVRDPVYRKGMFTGVLDQAPIAYAAAHKGDTVTVARKDVFDWLIKDGKDTRGGYTERALAPGQ